MAAASMTTRRIIPVLAAVVLATTALGGPLAAQTVTGRVVAEDTEAPLAGVFIRLMDDAGNRAAGFLSRQDGTFMLRAPSPGAYVLRLEMIGYRTLEETVRLEPDRTVARTIRMPLEAVQLDEVVASAPEGRRCTVRPAEGDALARLWDAARQGLQLAEWSEETGWVRASGYRYQRVLDVADLEVLAETAQRMASVEPNAFVAAEPSVIAAEGFLQATEDGGTLYRGADAALLLSDEFLDTHCFTLQERPEDGLVGLAFEPVPGRDVPEIEGVLWLEGATARLHSLEYAYTDYPIPAPLPRSRFGGLTEFRHLPGGGVSVERWRIRMPATTASLQADDLTAIRRCGRYACESPEDLERLARIGIAIEEEGGAIQTYRLPGGARLPASADAAIAGAVYDSTTAGDPAPLSGAEVVVVGTEHRAVTDDRGRFRIDNLTGGTYRLVFEHPKLLELGIRQPGAVVVDATAGALASAELALPSPATLALGRCGELAEDGLPRPGARVIHGTVVDAGTGAPVHGATVMVRAGAGQVPGQDASQDPGISADGGDRSDAAAGHADTLEQTSDPAGGYLFCDVPEGPVRVTASFLGKGEVARVVEAASGAALGLPFELVMSAAGRLLGRVVRANDLAPVPGATVRVSESGQEAVTNADGVFAFDSIAPGALTLEAEHIAYRPSTGAVAVHGGEVVEVELRVAEQVFELDPIVVTARSSPLLREERLGGFYIRQARGIGGTFYGPEELSARPGLRATDLLRETPGLRLDRSPTGTLVTSTRRPFASAGRGVCAPVLYLDGTRIAPINATTDVLRDATRMIDQFSADELAGIEVYPGASSVPGELVSTDSDCGVVAIWTRTRDRTRLLGEDGR